MRSIQGRLICYRHTSMFGFDAVRRRCIIAGMKSGIRWGFIKSLLSILALCSSLNATAATVGVGFFSLSPNPVSINVGDSVVWTDADEDFAPYVISGPWGSFSTWDPAPGVRFNSPGTYQYTAQSLFGGSWNGSVIVSVGVPNSPPVVTITNPTNNSVFIAPAAFAFEVAASDPDPDDLWDVEFWVNDEMVDDVYDPPYATTVTNLAAGTYTLMAIAWDFSFETTTNSITITVLNPSAITLTVSALAAGNFEFNATGLIAGKTNVLQTATNLESPLNWVSVSTNVADSSTASYTNKFATGQHFFRIVQLP